MARNREQRRLQLFDLYAENASLYFPSLKSQFICPLCRQVFGRDSVKVKSLEVDLAHVYPKSCGGKLETLTCKNCNSRMGSRADSHLVHQHRVNRALSDGTEQDAIPARLQVFGEEIGIRLHRDGTATKLVGSEKHSDPKCVTALEQKLKAGAVPDKGSITFRWVDGRMVRLAELHSAFLMMFREFGYEYVLSAASDAIRSSLEAEEKGDLNDLKEFRILGLPLESTFDPKYVLASVGILTRPEELRCFFVPLPGSPGSGQCRCVTLPGFGDEGKLAYENIRRASGRIAFDYTMLLPPPAEARLADASWTHYLHQDAWQYAGRRRLDE